MITVNQKLIRLLLTSAIMIVSPLVAVAQQGSPALPAPQGGALTCADFHQNPNGSWSPNRPVSINGVAMGTGVSFTEGVSFGGANIAAALDKQCR